MTDQMGDKGSHTVRDHAAWRERPLILAAIGVVIAVIFQQLVVRDTAGSYRPLDLPVWRIALAATVVTMGIAIGLGLERIRASWAVAFAATAGIVAGLVLYWQGDPGWSLFGEWSGISLFLALGIALPLFQTARDQGAWRFPYAQVHGHVLTDALLWCASCAFVGIVFLLAFLLAALFDLIGLKFLTRLLQKEWFDAALVGAAFGGALGVFRERDRVVRLLLNVVTSVLGVLAPVLGVGLSIFIIALPFTGLDTLWEATKSTTPILLGCVIGALVLANAVIGNGEEDEANNPVLRWGAMALALAMLPLAVLAAIATGLRIGQYGFTPDRLWALVAVILACVGGVVYLVALVRGRTGWAPFARASNLIVAFIVAGVALFLATPIMSFNAISTRDQVMRLETGKTKPEKFDWAALAFDFGDPGKAALKRLAASKNTAIATPAKSAAAAQSRWEIAGIETVGDKADALAKRLRIQPRTVPLPEGLLFSFQRISNSFDDKEGVAVLWYEPGATSAVLLSSNCETCRPNVTVTRMDAKGVWSTQENMGVGLSGVTSEENRNLAAALAKDGFQLQLVQRRQVFIGGKPVDDPFE